MSSFTNYLVILLVLSVSLSLGGRIKNNVKVNSYRLDVPKASAPGFYTSVTQSGLNYLMGVGVQLLEAQIKTIVIPDQSGTDGTPIGKVDWTLTSIQASSLSIEGATISLVPGSGLSFSITGLALQFSADWSYRETSWPHVSDHGTAQITAASVTITVAMLITDNSGRPYVQVTSDSVNIGSLDIKLSGGASWLYNFFLDILKGNVRDLIQKQLAQTISTSVDNGINSALATLPLTAPINPNTEISYQLMSNPVFTSSYMSLPESGEFYTISSPSECPSNYCPADNLPNVIDGNMVQMILGDYVANSGAYVFWQQKKLQLQVTDAQVPPSAPIRLNTTFWKYLVPSLTQAYPNNLMVLNIGATDSPKVTFTTSGAMITTVGNIDFMVVLSNGTLVSAFTLAGKVDSRALAFLTGQTIYGNVTYEDATFTLVSSNIGNVNVALLNNLLTLLINMGIVPAVNQLLAQGFPLPLVQGMTFVNPSIVWGNQYVAVSTNINYSPPQFYLIEESIRNTILIN